MRAPKNVFSFSDEDDDDGEAVLPLRARLAAAAEEKERKRARTSTAAKPRRLVLRVRPAAAAAAGVGVAVDDTDALDCGVCYHPLKPPIFQCDVGHVVCSSCRDKLEDTGKCHVCRGTTGGFLRCHAMERVVESARVVCPNAAYGCTDRPYYYDQQGHHRMCLYAPWRCPGEDCSFIGSKEELLQHFTGVHVWPCSTKVRAEEMSNIRLKDGFNFILLDGKQGATANAYRQCLLLLDVVRQPLSRAISVILVHPHATDDDQRLCWKKLKCELAYSWHLVCSSHSRSDVVTEHAQKSKFVVTCTDLYNGKLPNPDERFQFAVPNFVLAHDEKDGINVGFRIQLFAGLGTS